MILEEGSSVHSLVSIERVSVLMWEEAFLALEVSKQGFFFEDAGLENDRYAVFGFQPKTTHVLSMSSSSESLRDLARKIDREGASLRMSSQSNQFKSSVVESPFVGGLVGVLGFDYSCFIEELGLFRPEDTMGYVHCFTELVIFDKKNKQSIFLSFGPDSSHRVKELKNRLLFLKKKKPTSKGSKAFSFFLDFEESEETFLKQVHEVKKLIQRGDLFQCVLSRKKEGRFQGSPLALLKRFREQKRGSTGGVYFIQFGGKIMMGASPERLISVDLLGQIKSSPLAGTRPRGEDQKEDLFLEKELLSDAKEKAEHLMLVDLCRNDLGKVSEAGSVDVSEFMTVKRLGQVMHLSSEVRGLLKPSFSPIEALEASFPAGTLSGAPKHEALKTIQNLEGRSRGSYGGCFFYYDFFRRLNSWISIRGLEMDQDRLSYMAGAGIVDDSLPQSEAKEVNFKLQTVEEVLKK